jgi:hypothetical protein
MVSHRFCIASGIHNDNIIRGAARILNPLLKQCTTVLVCDNSTLGSSRRAIDAGALTRHRTSRAESLVQQVDVTNLTFHVPEGVAVILRKRYSLIKNHLEVASAVDDDIETLPDKVLS